MRIGQGYDVHKFGPGDKIVIGGVVIPHTHGLVAHSDGDVLLHALCDALLGACALGDIGHHFPDTDPQYKGANSRELLRLVNQKVRANGWQLGNADMTIIAQAPRMARHISAMCEAIAADLDCAINQVNVKATTTEKLGFTGREEGIAAQASVLLKPLVGEPCA
ncbi:2-C-methyl-D-erythritol 2,4-cyclodiphosphate synthase [uncultured Gilvimarinus sp.]|uniref:2-C-methyl-D-erythritol 2,4-cyclodiphosphate synthase n=1 Tax=uncultured Gilvimarinus sp. TaxID=1689143 RepID=UPI0030EF448B|tara:strand:- start:2431 stop:2922 length:492 start_codon:yes stop_codon:yes gene_type:complete